jgi:hypothetical protein
VIRIIVDASERIIERRLRFGKGHAMLSMVLSFLRGSNRI